MSTRSSASTTFDKDQEQFAVLTDLGLRKKDSEVLRDYVTKIANTIQADELRMAEQPDRRVHLRELRAFIKSFDDLPRSMQTPLFTAPATRSALVGKLSPFLSMEAYDRLVGGRSSWYVRKEDAEAYGRTHGPDQPAVVVSERLETKWSRLTVLWGNSLLRDLGRADQGGSSAGTRAAEMEGLRFAFYARLTAILVVTVWLAWLVPWPRSGYYGFLALVFFVLGFVPYRFRQHRHAEAIKLFFTLLDVALVTAAILLPPPIAFGPDWPIQTRLRGQEFLYVVLLLGEAALTYSPLRVLWTGSAICGIWSLGVYTIYSLPSSARYNEVADPRSFDAAGTLALFLDPTFVGLTAWRTQIIATALLTLLITLAVWRSRQTLMRQVEAEIMRADFARYVSPDVADALSEKGISEFEVPRNRNVSVIFADLVDFTQVSETFSPEQTFVLLRSFQERSCRVVFKHGGTLDKYLGDGFMATFGAIGDRTDAAAAALACAFDLQCEIDRWNRKRSGRGALPVRLSVGVHCGPVTVGNLGSQRRVEFAVIGDVVNVASRLEELTREHGAMIATSDDCLRSSGSEDLAKRFQESQLVRLRGRTQPVLVHFARS